MAQGRLVGGNLSLVCAMIGTPYAAPIKGHLMFLEEVGEEPYRIDRMLTQLEQGGLAQAAGVVLGVFRKCVVAAGDASLSLQEVVEDRLSGLRIPAAYGYSFGHIAEQYPLPVGLKARLDTEARTITLLERAVTPY